MKGKLVLSVTIDDCEVQTFRAGGKGGQHQNKRDTGVRVIHRPSGARGECREERSQLQNKRKAFLRMIETVDFKLWMNRELLLDSEKDRINKKFSMEDSNLRVEHREGDRWVSGVGEDDGGS